MCCGVSGRGGVIIKGWGDGALKRGWVRVGDVSERVSEKGSWSLWWLGGVVLVVVAGLVGVGGGGVRGGGGGGGSGGMWSL